MRYARNSGLKKKAGSVRFGPLDLSQSVGRIFVCEFFGLLRAERCAGFYEFFPNPTQKFPAKHRDGGGKGYPGEINRQTEDKTDKRINEVHEAGEHGFQCLF